MIIGKASGIKSPYLPVMDKDVDFDLHFDLYLFHFLLFLNMSYYEMSINKTVSNYRKTAV